LTVFGAVTLTYPLAMVLGNLGFALFLALRRREIAA
jgi:hypothetical protein